MIIIDGDYPMAYGARYLDRDLTLPIDEVQATETDPNNVSMATIPEMRKAEIAAALVKVVGRIYRKGNPLPGFRAGETAYAAAQGDLAYYRILERRGHARILNTSAEFSDHMQSWLDADNSSELPVGFILGMEGADPILWPKHLHDWWRDGVRVVSLTHYGVTTYAHGTGTPGGLLPPARELLKEMRSIGMILDLTHIADQSFWEAVEIYDGPVLASHQNCRSLVPGERQFTDEQLRVVIERDGVIGASMDTWMLHPTAGRPWNATVPIDRRGYFPREDITLENLADHVDHVCNLAGNARHAAIGGDTDGQGGLEGAPNDVNSVADYQKLGEILGKRGYADEDVANVMYGNWKRFFESHLPS